jgi:hypothetical protein
MIVEFVVARNPDESSSLPFLIRLPLGPNGVALKVRETWPRTNKVYCHRADDWSDDLEVIERVPVRSCVRRGAAIDLVLDRAREHRSQFVFTRARGREMIFWQSARTTKQARPAVSLPTARAAGHVFEILVDSHERYAWKFEQQQASTSRMALPAGDYAIAVGGDIIAAVERKSLADLVKSVRSEKLGQVADEFDGIHSVQRALAVGSLDRILPAAELRPYLVDAIERGMAKERTRING